MLQMAASHLLHSTPVSPKGAAHEQRLMEVAAEPNAEALATALECLQHLRLKSFWHSAVFLNAAAAAEALAKGVSCQNFFICLVTCMLARPQVSLYPPGSEMTASAGSTRCSQALALQDCLAARPADRLLVTHFDRYPTGRQEALQRRKERPLRMANTSRSIVNMTLYLQDPCHDCACDIMNQRNCKVCSLEIVIQ